MIILPPFDACPDCGYTLNPPKSDGRCPECGMSLSDKTVIFRPTPQIRRLAIWLLVLIGVAWVAQIMSFTLGAMIVSPPIALTGIGLLFLVAAIIVIRAAFPSASRRPTLILTHDAVTLIHGDNHRQLAFDEIKGAERFNIYPEISLNTGRPVSLIGIFDDNHEWLTFAELLIQFKNGRFEGITESIERFKAPAKPPIWTVNRWSRPGKPRTPLQQRARLLTAIGIIAIAVAYGLLTSLVKSGGAPSGLNIVMLLLLLFIGIIVALTGQWYSDPRSKTSDNRKNSGS
ncbi:MAG: hypothetical protein IPK83_21450 [Planctomycetes bacterium]|nr:hypothetical protein [Planctomycetota bacterium]